MNEVWKDLPEYEGYYQMSTTGKIRSLDRIITPINASSYRIKGKIKKINNNILLYIKIMFL